MLLNATYLYKIIMNLFFMQVYRYCLGQVYSLQCTGPLACAFFVSFICVYRGHTAFQPFQGIWASFPFISLGRYLIKKLKIIKKAFVMEFFYSYAVISQNLKYFGFLVNMLQHYSEKNLFNSLLAVFTCATCKSNILFHT